MTSYYHRPPIDCCSAPQTAKAKGQTLIMSRQKEPFLIRHECKIWTGNYGWHAQVRDTAHPSGNPLQLYSIFTLVFVFCVSTGALECVCVSCKRACVYVYIHIWASTRCTCWCKVPLACDVPHVCTRSSCVHMLAQLFPLRVRKEVVFGGDKYTGCTLSAATQTQAGCMPAVKRGLYLCMCVTLCVWIKGGEAGEGYEHVWRFCLQGEG